MDAKRIKGLQFNDTNEATVKATKGRTSKAEEISSSSPHFTGDWTAGTKNPNKNRNKNMGA